MHVGASRRTYGANGKDYTDVTINLSGIPATSSAGLIEAMMGQAIVGLDHILDEIARRAHAVTGHKVEARNVSAFAPAAPSVETKVEKPALQVVDGGGKEEAESPLLAALRESVAAEIAKKKAELGEDYDPFAEDATQIPHASEVTIGGTVFGVDIQAPPDEWHSESLSTVDRETQENGGQRVAVNAALCGIGYSNSLRHPAALAILQEYGSLAGQPARPELRSINDLTKAEAHIILSYISAVEKSPSSLALLAKAVDVRRAK